MSSHEYSPPGAIFRAKTSPYREGVAGHRLNQRNRVSIARALASAGSDIVLNGFGKPEQVAELRQEIAADYRVRVTYSAADMSSPDAIQKMAESSTSLRPMAWWPLLTSRHTSPPSTALSA
jgi:hypothetical protein